MNYLNKPMKTIKDILKADNYEQRRRIANNLAISKEDKNALIVNKSSGGSGGTSKIHYYGFDSSAVISEFKSLDTDIGDESIIMFLELFCSFASAYIYDSKDSADGIHYRGFTPRISSMWDAHRVDALVVDEDIYYGQYPYITKGDLHNKINYFIKTMTKESPEDAEMIKTIFDICLKHTTEITEDEFFGMCDLPITPLPE